jgi:glycosyltransferase involved in cell wall biosynthesis
LKILVALTYHYPHWTGLTAYARRLSEGLAKRGHDVTVLTSRFRPQLERAEVYNGVRILRLPTLVRLSRGVVMPGFSAALNEQVPRHDVVQVHTPMLETNLVAGVARRHGRATLITHHGDLVMPKNPKDQLIERAVTALMTRGARKAARITVHSRDYAENSAFLAPFLAKVQCIYPPVEIPAPNPAGVAAWRAELGLTGKPVIGFAGRFVEEKGFDHLLQAMPHVRAEIPQARFVYAGETGVVYERFFERWQPSIEREQVVMLGLIHDPQRLADFYSLCDVFALPSRTDCFPSVQIEAMLSGTPVVATDIPGTREAVRVSGMGKLVTPGDPRAIAAGLVEVLRRPEEFRRTRDQIRAIFDGERTLDEYEALLASLADRCESDRGR